MASPNFLHSGGQERRDVWGWVRWEGSGRKAVVPDPEREKIHHRHRGHHARDIFNKFCIDDLLHVNDNLAAQLKRRFAGEWEKINSVAGDERCHRWKRISCRQNLAKPRERHQHTK